MRSGARAVAIVLESRSWGWSTGPVRPNNKLKLKVQFADRSTMTVTRIERTRFLLQDRHVGSTLPMRHDPADRSYVDIDRQALLERHARFEEQTNRARIKEAKDRLRGQD